MSLRFDSLLIILNKLDSGEIVTNRSLMEELDISERSAYRYIQSLIIANFPIWFDRKRKTYAFVEGYRLKRQKIPLKEEVALSIAQSLVEPMGKEVTQALEGIRNRLCGTSSEQTEKIIHPDRNMPGTIADYLSQLYRAISERRVVEFNYRLSPETEPFGRKIDPLYLFNHDGFWYVRGLCHNADNLRTFAFDRIIALDVTNEHYRKYDINEAEELESAFGPQLDGEPTDVVLRFNPEIARQVMRKKWHLSQKEKRLPDGRIELSFTVIGTETIKHWLYRWLPSVEVVSPATLRTQVYKELLQGTKQHKVPLDET
ncbi:hypothetical protein OR1_02155 [Geobacter sp. OR-1]|uniref:helix-turn-helix transcriptional regulator n=1 Tax=Geobacter sp. OR-1 TaxID=1266765 RepID=UPI00054279EE|nr:WYL domain-containing protein [Geobacter sp. OR-1]GAM09873.1 hypothetical protein OR1_02155 [Geobacter sp. OR-1]